VLAPQLPVRGHEDCVPLQQACSQQRPGAPGRMLTAAARADLRQDQGRYRRAPIVIQGVMVGKNSSAWRIKTHTLSRLSNLLARGVVAARNLWFVIIAEEISVVIWRRVSSCRCNRGSCR
jgi:hypothetical protein